MPYVLYRAIKRSRPSLSDFWSDFALGVDPLPSQLREPIRWAGISMFSNQAKAVATAKRWAHGRAVVRVEIPDGAPVLVVQTGHDPHHFSVMGTPASLFALVVGDPV